MRITRFRYVRAATLIAALLCAGSMLMYPGGTHLDSRSRRYSLTHNFLSDLGTTVAFNGEPNRIGSLLFVASLGVLVVAFGAGLLGFVSLYSTTPAARRLARASAVLGFLICTAFVGVALTPEDRVMALHIQFTFAAFRAFPVVVVSLALAAARNRKLPGVIGRVWLALAGVLVSYVAMLEWGPAASTPQGLSLQAIAQKTIAVAAITTFLFQSWIADRHWPPAAGSNDELKLWQRTQ